MGLACGLGCDGCAGEKRSREARTLTTRLARCNALPNAKGKWEINDNGLLQPTKGQEGREAERRKGRSLPEENTKRGWWWWWWWSIRSVVVGGMLQPQLIINFQGQLEGQDPENGIRPAWLFGADRSRFPHSIAPEPASPHRASRLPVLVARLAVPCR